MRILLIEDNAHAAQTIALMLRHGQGDKFQIQWAQDLEDGVRMASQETFDVVLLDLLLPSTQGLDTLRAWHDRFPHLAVVVLTGMDAAEDAICALRQGAQDYLSKAELDPRMLIRAISYAWERKQSQLRLEEARLQLATKVAERTAELSRAVRELEEEIARREVAQKDLAHTEKFFRSVSESLQIAVLVINAQDEIIYVNRAFEEFTGQMRSRLLGVNLASREAPASLRPLVPLYQKSRQTGHPTPFDDLAAPGYDGGMRSFSGWMIPQINDGIFASMICTLHDITQRKQTEQRLRESEAKWRSLTENSMDRIYLLDMAGTVLFVNSALGGRPRSEVIGTRFLEHLEPDHRAEFLACQDKVQRTGIPQVFEMDYGTGPDRAISLEGQVSPVLEGSHLTGFTVSLRDITERKAHAAQLASQTRNLEEVNIALRVLVKHRYDEKQRLETDVTSNLRKLVMPYLERLGQSHLSREQKALVEIISGNLKEITSTFSSVLSSHQVGLTPRELEVARMVQLGYSSSHIADTLSISCNAVGFHRRNIRKKLGINGRGINLRGYLMRFAPSRSTSDDRLYDT